MYFMNTKIEFFR